MADMNESTDKTGELILNLADAPIEAVLLLGVQADRLRAKAEVARDFFQALMDMASAEVRRRETGEAPGVPMIRVPAEVAEYAAALQKALPRELKAVDLRFSTN
jgi:hypothetical protein